MPEAGVTITKENPLLPAAFVGASADGSKVFFVTKTQLTENARGHEPELYEYETETAHLTLISTSEAEPEGNVDFVGAVSSDGQAVYFTAFGDLAPGAEKRIPGESTAPINLYRYDTLTGKTTFVTTIDTTDYPLKNHNVEGEPNWTVTPGAFDRVKAVGLVAGAEWYTTADGEYLVFGSYRPITGFDNDHPPGGFPCGRLLEEQSAPESCMELYRYDAAADSIVCVSCAGGAPVDNATFARDAFGLDAAGSPRPISEDGRVVFFDTENVLVPQAVPGRVHVYEWHEGTISLISAPDDPGNAFFLGSGASGDDVFFSTHAQLAPSDTDQSTDIYDARVEGGFGGVTRPACTGTGCQGVPAAAPVFATPASVTFAGDGNLPTEAVQQHIKIKVNTKRCKRRGVKRHGRCVKQPRRLKRRT
jgi:hypothetical protein